MPKTIKGQYRCTDRGFSLLELAVVISILSIIAAISFPSIVTWIAKSKVDSAKTIVNSAAADCLQQIREGGDPTRIGPNSNIINDENLKGLGYRLNNKTCDNLMIEPENKNDNNLFAFGFKASSQGQLVKIALPSSNSSMLSSCQNWGGVNCGVSAEQQSIWDAIAKIEAAKKACNEEFYAWLQKPSSGSYNRWDETTKSCTLVTWAFEGSIQKDEQAVKDARAAKLGALCTAKLKEKETAKYDGAFTDPDCGTTYFCSGKDLATDNKTAYDACKEQERQMKCTAALGAWKTSAINGQFNVSGCTTMWQCNGQYLTTQADYDATSCGCTWVDEQYQTGTTTQTVQTGTTSTQTCTKSLFGRCVAYGTITTPTYGIQEVPVYGTRKVCKKI